MCDVLLPLSGRTPHGVRDATTNKSDGNVQLVGSHPSRGAWIEITRSRLITIIRSRRTPHGVRGLKFAGCLRLGDHAGRTPHGVRGLKFALLVEGAGGLGRTPHGVRGLK